MLPDKLPPSLRLPVTPSVALSDIARMVLRKSALANNDTPLSNVIIYLLVLFCSTLLLFLDAKRTHTACVGRLILHRARQYVLTLQEEHCIFLTGSNFSTFLPKRSAQ